MTEKTLYVLVIWNFTVFCIYGTDKYKAIHNKWRISEKFLLISAAMMGSFGALFGMEFFRHKTKKPIFKLVIPLLALVQSAAICYVWRKI